MQLVSSNSERGWIMLVPNQSTREFLAERLQEYASQLETSPEGLTYLANRGLTKETIKDFELGFVADPLKGDKRFQNRIAIPYLTPSGVVSFKFRSIDPQNPERFAKDKNDPSRIFNTRVLKRAFKVVITEGELDAVAATQCGYDAVGIPGAKQWKPEWNRVFYNRSVIVLADGDDAGEEFAERVAEQLYGVRIISMPHEEDVLSMVKERGEKYVRGLVE